MIGRVSDGAARAAIAPALRAIHAEPGGSWERLVLAQLVALVEHVDERGADPTAARRQRLAAVLDALRDNPLVASSGTPEERAAAALVAAVGHDDAAADEVRAVLRPVLLAELDDELAVTTAMLDGFRGRLRDRGTGRA